MTRGLGVVGQKGAKRRNKRIITKAEHTNTEGMKLFFMDSPHQGHLTALTEAWLQRKDAK